MRYDDDLAADSSAGNWQDIDAFLERTHRQTKQRITEELERIDKQLEKRNAIHNTIVTELESKIDWYTDRLEKLYKQSAGIPNGCDELKQQIADFYAELRTEQRQHWKDKQRLEADKRKLLRELTALNDSPAFERKNPPSTNDIR